MNTTLIDDLARSAGGFHAGAGRLAEMDRALAFALQTAKGLGDKSGLSGDWKQDWLRRWEHVAAMLERIKGQLAGMDGFLQHGDKDSLRGAMDTWKSIQSQDLEMSQMLVAIRSLARGLGPDARQEWCGADEAITAHIESLHALALALRVKLELMKDYTKDEVNHVLGGMLSRLPNRAGSDTRDAEAYVQQYRETVHELDEERHEFGGFLDFIKGLAMWVETPDERMKKKPLRQGK